MKDNDDCLKVDGKYMDWKKQFSISFPRLSQFFQCIKKKKCFELSINHMIICLRINDQAKSMLSHPSYISENMKNKLKLPKVHELLE